MGHEASGLEGLRRPALLPDVARHGRGRGDGDDRARLRRADRQGAARWSTPSSSTGSSSCRWKARSADCRRRQSGRRTRSRSSAWSPTCTRRGPSTSTTTRCRPGARRSGGSRRSSGCAACTPTRRSTARASAPSTTPPRASSSSRSAADSPLLGSSGFVPDRPDRGPGLAREPASAFAVDGPGRRRARPPGVHHAHRHRRRARHGDATSVITAGAHSRGDRGAALRGLGDPGRQRRDRRRRRRRPDRRQHRRLGRRRRARRPPARAGRPRRPLQARRRHLRRHVVRHDTTAEYAGPGGDVEMLGLYFADAGQHIEHRLFVDHTAPQDQEPRDLQGRAAGRGRAHGLDRQRADPQGRRGHRDLRGEPQPRAHRRLPGRLGAQPRDRDRRDRGRRPRVRDRPLRRRAAVLPALARHRRGRGAPPGRARLLQRPDPPDRRARARGAAGRHRRGRAAPRTS